jgi:hypothetical protein
MKMFSRILFSLFLLSVLAFGQPARGDAAKRIEELQRRLNLSAAQREQIRPILEDEAAKLTELRAKAQTANSRRSRRNLPGELNKIQEDAQKRIEPILTPEQTAEWKKIREERRNEFRERPRR